MVQDRCVLLISPYLDLPPSEMLRLERSWNFRALSNPVMSPPTTLSCVSLRYLVFRFYLNGLAFLVLRSNALFLPSLFTICLLHLHRIGLIPRSLITCIMLCFSSLYHYVLHGYRTLQGLTISLPTYLAVPQYLYPLGVLSYFCTYTILHSTASPYDSRCI
jgi:hypothetical protein